MTVSERETDREKPRNKKVIEEEVWIKRQAEIDGERENIEKLPLLWEEREIESRTERESREGYRKIPSFRVYIYNVYVCECVCEREREIARERERERKRERESDGNRNRRKRERGGETNEQIGILESQYLRPFIMSKSLLVFKENAMNVNKEISQSNY